MRLYRFETAFDGEPQGVGLFQDLEAVDLIEAKDIRVLFKDLPVPKLEHLPSPVSFWFTADGLARFLPELERTSDWLTEHSWALNAAVIDVCPGLTVYKDRFQAAIYVDDLPDLEYHILDYAYDVFAIMPNRIPKGGAAHA